MAQNLILQLSNSKGLMRVLVFTGLRYPMVVHPTIHGEPLLTAQAFYYLEELESVAHVQYEGKLEDLSEDAVEYLVDNYLFEYSKHHSDSKMTAKVTEPKFWRDDPTDLYLLADQGHTRTLAIDQRNDPHVKYIKPVGSKNDVDLGDWNIGRNYAANAFQKYLNELTDILHKRVEALVEPSEDRDGYVGRLRVVRCDGSVIDRYQAEALDNLPFRAIPSSGDSIALIASDCVEAVDMLPIERVVSFKEHTPLLLSHYFSGVKEFNPLKAYVGFYNVLEYYFEEAPLLLNRPARTELEQLGCVLDLLTNNEVIAAFVNDSDNVRADALASDIETSSGAKIKAFNPSNSNEYAAELARWLYEIRCAIVHSKKTRKGLTTPSFQPYSAVAKKVEVAIPIVRWLAVLCIENDYVVKAAAARDS
jgi:hypothetical protein